MGEPAALSDADRKEMRELAIEIINEVIDDTRVPLVVLVDHDPDNINGTVLRLAQLVKEQAETLAEHERAIERVYKEGLPF